jgi:hypothetical protein
MANPSLLETALEKYCSDKHFRFFPLHTPPHRYAGVRKMLDINPHHRAKTF